MAAPQATMMSMKMERVRGMMQQQQPLTVGVQQLLRQLLEAPRPLPMAASPVISTRVVGLLLLVVMSAAVAAMAPQQVGLVWVLALSELDPQLF